MEKAFDVYKNVLNADKMYLQDNERRIWSFIYVLNKVSPMDLMDEYAKVYKVEYGDKELMSEVL